MQFTGTRYLTTRLNGYPQMTGGAEYVSQKLSPQATATAPWGNAGAFCTSRSVVGASAYLAAGDARSGAYAGFWAYGINNGQRTSSGLPVKSLPPAPQVAQTDPALLPADALRVNGAAVRPKCQ